jgi:hypothetical protein
MALAERSALRLVMGYKSELEEVLNRFIYYYQKGLYYRTVALAALQGDDEWALEAATDAQGMSFTAGVEISLAPGNGGMGSWPSLMGVTVSCSASSWEYIGPWGAPGYAMRTLANGAISRNVVKLGGAFGSLSLTFEGYSAFLDDLTLGLNGGQGSLFKAFRALEGTFGEYRAWFEFLLAAVGILVGAISLCIATPFCFGIGWVQLSQSSWRLSWVGDGYRSRPK